MNETMVTVVGNVATAPVFRELPSGTVTRFRLAATARHRDRATGTWADGHTNFFTVWAWRGLGTNVVASLSVGEPVIVQGRLKVRNEERGGGQQWMSADIDAVVVGHDLSRGTAAFRKATWKPDRTPGTQQLSPAEQQPPWSEADISAGDVGALSAAEKEKPALAARSAADEQPGEDRAPVAVEWESPNAARTTEESSSETAWPGARALDPALTT